MILGAQKKDPCGISTRVFFLSGDGGPTRATEYRKWIHIESPGERRLRKTWTRRLYHEDLYSGLIRTMVTHVYYNNF